MRFIHLCSSIIFGQSLSPKKTLFKNLIMDIIKGKVTEKNNKNSFSETLPSIITMIRSLNKVFLGDND